MLFHMVPSVLLSMVASITTYFKESDWLTNQKMVEKATMESKTEGTMWKSIKSVSEIGVKNDFTFCLGPLIETTNSELCFKPWCFVMCTCLINRSTLSGLMNSMTAELDSLLTLMVLTFPHAVVIELIWPKSAVGGRLVIKTLAEVGRGVAAVAGARTAISKMKWHVFETMIESHLATSPGLFHLFSLRSRFFLHSLFC